MAALDQWENRLKPYFNRSLRIIGEIPLTRMEVEDMLAGVKACIQRNGLAEATQILTGRYPHLFLTFLAGFAAHNTEQAYWIALGQRLGVNHNHLFNHRWHNHFHRIIKHHGLLYFDSDDSANPFVTTIRFHGGIPAYSLPDFFERLLLPTIKRPALREAPTRQAMQAVLKTAYFVDSPVINFLENSGSLGEQFFDSCRKLARHYLQNQGDLLPAAILNLPEYVVDAFADFMEQGEEEGQPLRLRKPVLGADPFGERDGILLKLPEQEIELRYAAGSLEWQVTWPGKRSPEQVSCKLLRRRQSTLIREIFFPIYAAPNQISVSLVYTDNDCKDCDSRKELLRRWTLPLVPLAGRAPLLAFKADGEMIRTSRSLPAGIVRLIYPIDADLRVGGQGRQSEIYGAMYGEWEDWQIHEWNLTEAWSIEVVRDGQALGPMVSVAGRQPEPELTAGTRSPFGTPDTPLYIGEPPEVKIPLRPGLDSAEELGRWRIELSSIWDTQPPVQVSESLKKLADTIRLEGGSDEELAAFIPLTCLLGNQPVGTFLLVMHGPGSTSTEFRLRLWPKLTTLNLPKHFLSVENNNEPVTFLLRIPEKSSCEVQAGAGDVRVRENVAGWEVTAGPDVTDVNLNLTWQGAGKIIVRVPITIPIPRLRWSLALDDDQAKMQWSGTPLQKSALALLQSGTSSIHVQAHGLEIYLNRLRLELVEVEDTERSVQEANFQKTVFSPNWLRVPLGQFSGSLKNECQQGRFDLVLLPRRDEPGMRVPLLLAPRSLDIRDVTLSQLEETTWELTWHEAQPLRNRRFLLVPAWQPWQEPWEYKIPDDAHGSFRLEHVSIPKTRYHVYFYIAPGWEPARPTPPGDLKPHVIDLCAPITRLAEVEWQPHNTPEEQFRALAEKVCIFEDIGDRDNRDQALSQCTTPFNHLTNLRLILGLLEWFVVKKIDSPYRNYFWRTVFHPNKVKAILALYKQPDPLLTRYINLAGQGAVLYGESALLIAEKSDDPAIIHACMKSLLDKEDEILILLVLEMIQTARLSNRDAVNLLSLKPLWAVKKLAAQESDPQVDRLLAALLPSLGQQTDFSYEIISELILRSMPYENHPSVKMMYLEILITHESEEGVRMVVQAAHDGVIPHEEAERILSLAPQHVFQVLENTEPIPHIQKWIAWIVKKFPWAVGVIRVGTKIDTPIGIGIVDRIEDLLGNEIHQTLLDRHDSRLNLLIGDGADRFRVWMNLNDNTITFYETQKAWQCPYCNYAHPDQRGIDRHYNQRHPSARRIYRAIPSTIPVFRSKIKILVR